MGKRKISEEIVGREVEKIDQVPEKKVKKEKEDKVKTKKAKFEGRGKDKTKEKSKKAHKGGDKGMTTDSAKQPNKKNKDKYNNKKNKKSIVAAAIATPEPLNGRGLEKGNSAIVDEQMTENDIVTVDGGQTGKNPKSTTKPVMNQVTPASLNPPSSPSSKQDASQELTIFVGQLPYDLNEQELKDHFKHLESVTSARLIIDRKTNKPKGIGYVDFASEKDFKAALQMNGSKLKDRNIKVDACQPRTTTAFANKPTSSPSPILFVGNLSFETTEKKLQEHFSQYGDIISVRIPTDKFSHKPKGYGYVQFTSMESAKSAMANTRINIDGRTIRLDYDHGGKQNGPRRN